MAASDETGATQPEVPSGTTVPRTGTRSAFKTYRTWLRSHIIDHCPRTLLDVGCGDGSLLDWAQAQGIEAIGVDPAPRTADPRILNGRAEALPLDTDSFDLVVFELSLHHAGDPALAIAEAKRVARDVVIVMDPWFSPPLPGQTIAERFDRWSKRIDRMRGMDHLDCFTVDAMRSLAGDSAVSLSYLVQLQWRDPDEVLAFADRQVIDADEQAVATLGSLREEIKRDGLTETGVQLALFG